MDTSKYVFFELRLVGFAKQQHFVSISINQFYSTVICVLITHTWYLWVCKEESQIDDARDILEEETAHDLIAKYISSFRTLSIAKDAKDPNQHPQNAAVVATSIDVIRDSPFKCVSSPNPFWTNRMSHF